MLARYGQGEERLSVFVRLGYRIGNLSADTEGGKALRVDHYRQIRVMIAEKEIYVPVGQIFHTLGRARCVEIYTANLDELFDTEHSAHCECPVSAEVVSIAAKEMIVEAKKIAKIHKKVVVKIPLIPEGIKAVKELSGLGIKTNVTLCFTAAQALLAAKAGATYVSPFIGRLNDIDQRGLDLIREIKQIFTNYDIKTQILAASIRSPRQVVEIALIGADVVTIPYKVFEKLFNHPLTDKGLKQFLADWDQYKKTQ